MSKHTSLRGDMATEEASVISEVSQMRGVDGDRSVGWLKFSSALTAPFSLNNGEGKDKDKDLYF